MLKWLRANYTLGRLILDLVLTELALFLAGIVRPVLSFMPPSFASRTDLPVLVYVLVGIIWILAFLLLSVYSPHRQRAVDEAQKIFVAVSLTTLALTGVLFFAVPQASRLQIVIFYGLNLTFLIGSRLTIRATLRFLDRPRYGRRKILILGGGEIGQDIVRMIERHKWSGLEPVGFLDDNLPAGSMVEGYPVLGPISQVADRVEVEEVNQIVVALPIEAIDHFFWILTNLQKLPVQVCIVPDHVKSFLFRSTFEELAGVPMIVLHEAGLTRFERQIKRAFDLVVGTILFIAAVPLLTLIALIIRLDSPGPSLFKQERVGEGGKLFLMYKFRSMVQDAEKQQKELVSFDQHGQLLFKHADDPRVTKVGKFLRRTSLDELPQILNVLKGEMSLVGPRPEMPWIVERYESWQYQRFSVPQGITGWWQVNGRSDKPMHLHTEEDLYYIQNYSLLLDIEILWKTAGAVIKGQGAY
ncbi:MAG: sugar transferase [Anaerolineae bacterium]|jgi:exopolysaccharide biosynthesis polyprenyl glycosylphosphotransferase